MPSIQQITLSRSFEIEVRYLIEPAEKDIGHPRSVDIVSVSIYGKPVHLSSATYESLANEILDIEE